MPDPITNLSYDGPSLSTRERYSNPFFGVPHKFLPQNIDHMLWWASHFLLRFGFYRAALQRIANYFITSIKIECDDNEVKKSYQQAFDQLHWKQVLSQGGLNLLAYGNLFMTVQQGFERSLECSNCKKITSIHRMKDYEFSPKAEYKCRCVKCKMSVKHYPIDRPIKDVSRIVPIFWNPRDIIVRYDETSNSGEYYWKIPGDYKQKALKGNNRFYSKYTSKIIYDCLLDDKLVYLNPKNFVHVKIPTPAGIRTDGKAIPYCIYLFDDFFMLKVLQRYNEAISFEDIVPFRVISMSDGNPQSNPILGQSSTFWRANVENMIKEHRQDPGSYHVFPFPIQYQQLSGDGKNLVPQDLIAQAISNILNALQIPQELMTMTLQVQAIGPALRLFENSWSCMIDSYNIILAKMADVIGSIKGYPPAKVSLVPVTLSDDMERKSIIAQLVSANSIARSELLNLYNFDYEDQLRKKHEEEMTEKKLQEESQVKEQLRQMAEAGSGGGQQQAAPTTPGDVLSNAQQLAQELFPLDNVQRREKLQQIKQTDLQLYSTTKSMLADMTRQARSQGAEQMKQQMNQQGGQA